MLACAFTACGPGGQAGFAFLLLPLGSTFTPIALVALGLAGGGVTHEPKDCEEEARLGSEVLRYLAIAIGGLNVHTIITYEACILI